MTPSPVRNRPGIAAPLRRCAGVAPRPLPLAPRPAPLRPAATLVEVLMSLMIIGLGVTSVFTLFPMSVIRSVKATTQTNSALSAHNAREQILTGVFRNGNDLVQPPNPTFQGTFFVDPLGMRNGLGNTFGSGGGATGVTRLSGFPNQQDNRVVTAIPAYTLNDRFCGPDSWVTVVEALPDAVTPAGFTPGSITLPVGTDLTSLGGSLGANSHIVLYNRNRTASVVLPKNPLSTIGITGTTLNIPITETIPPAYQFDFGECRIENYERRYSWLLHVDRDSNSRAQMQCVIYFRRPFDVESEQSYPLVSLTTTPPPINLNDPREITVDLTGGDPVLKRGDYVFGLYTSSGRRGKWFRILSVTTDSVNDLATIVLDSAWPVAAVDVLPMGTPDGIIDSLPRVVFPQGVVGVYDL